ncbi:hypothetical protein CEXT_654501 [Caerostris extrusa]|uniref:Uncharacterized protein n=1 Tax=Caerostris extrusa TaxID=172846 RepID=A0AAV4WWB4_CAEEX|nr:hypothetical protein CEXT_654501 [Caerostris extrusa]
MTICKRKQSRLREQTYEWFRRQKYLRGKQRAQNLTFLLILRKDARRNRTTAASRQPALPHCPTWYDSFTLRAAPIDDALASRPRLQGGVSTTDCSDSRSSSPRGPKPFSKQACPCAVNAIQESSEAIIFSREQDNYTGLDVALMATLSVSR